jgi:two-component system, cell cycle sensor histidine kinase and response regulator CckA
VKVVLELEEDLHDIDVDCDRLEQTIVNLAANARDAMPEGGTLTFRTSEVKLDDEDGERPSDGTDRFVALRVTDTGSGMSREVQGEAFDDLFSTKADGAGLGLASVRRFVARSGGMVSVQSQVDQGTTFALYLPITAVVRNGREVAQSKDGSLRE